MQKIVNFFREVMSEKAKISWPGRKETALTTLFVFIFCAIASVYFLIVDQSVIKLLEFIRGL
ncbi:MAG: preprotein translocase subunit SecE [Candidatus Puniceispirillum sp.]|nr:preprotein translocase subunit SecE [Candidatus Pelagibacter sp.]MBA4283561.1 preprotein translocase subunit SecE [Candidatus Puniceispirillum sp.]